MVLQREASVAIYWDFENIHASVMTVVKGLNWFADIKNGRIDTRDTAVLDIAAIMQYASTLGEVVINRAYANWSFFWPYTDALNGYSMDLVQLFPIGKNAKNGADIRLSLDIAEDLVAHPHIDIVLLVSGDSDFIAIAQRVRRRHKRIIGLGVERTSNRFWQMACNEFKLYHTIVAQHGRVSDAEDRFREPARISETPASTSDSNNITEAPTPPATNGKASAKTPSGTKKATSVKTSGTKSKTTASAKTSGKNAEPTPVSEPQELDADNDQNEPLLELSESASAVTERRLLVQALQSLEAREGKPWVMRVKIKPMMTRLDPAFDEANLGYSNFTEFLEGNDDLVELRPTESDVLVRVKPAKRAPRRSERGRAVP